jgi:hypothetical protein
VAGVSGIIERVATGAKEPFQGMEAIGAGSHEWWNARVPPRSPGH